MSNVKCQFEAPCHVPHGDRKGVVDFRGVLYLIELTFHAYHKPDHRDLSLNKMKGDPPVSNCWFALVELSVEFLNCHSPMRDEDKRHLRRAMYY